MAFWFHSCFGTPARTGPLTRRTWERPSPNRPAPTPPPAYAFPRLLKIEVRNRLLAKKPWGGFCASVATVKLECRSSWNAASRGMRKTSPCSSPWPVTLTDRHPLGTTSVPGQESRAGQRSLDRPCVCCDYTGQWSVPFHHGFSFKAQAVTRGHHCPVNEAERADGQSGSLELRQVMKSQTSAFL